jgi:hypothetical protein
MAPMLGFLLQRSHASSTPLRVPGGRGRGRGRQRGAARGKEDRKDSAAGGMPVDLTGDCLQDDEQDSEAAIGRAGAYPRVVENGAAKRKNVCAREGRVRVE